MAVNFDFFGKQVAPEIIDRSLQIKLFVQQGRLTQLDGLRKLPLTDKSRAAAITKLEGEIATAYKELDDAASRLMKPSPFGM